MSLTYALLTALAEQSATGYELNQRFKERLANIWQASHQQIYKELAKLLDRGWLNVETIQQPDRPDKKVYEITPIGLEALKQWLNEPQSLFVEKNPLLIKFFAGQYLDLELFKQEVQQVRLNLAQKLQSFSVIQQLYFQELSTLSSHYQWQYLALRYGMMSLEASLKWLDEVEHQLKQLDLT